MGEIKQDILNAFDIKNQSLFLAEIYLKDLYPLANLKRRFSRLPAYPAVERDISIVVNANTGAEQLSDCIKSCGQPFIKEVKVADFYTGEHIPRGSKGLTLSCKYLSDARTLEDSEVNTLHQKILENLKTKFNVQFR